MKHNLLYCQEKFTDHVVAAYFFNARGSILEKTPLGMLRSLMYQLLEQNSLLSERFIPKFLDKQSKHEKEWAWRVGDLKIFLLSEYKKRQPKPVLLLIDALDECNESEVREVVNFLEDLSKNAIGSNSTLKICLSSRHYPTIGMGKKLELIVEKQDEHDQDISKYVRYKLRVTNKGIEKQILDKAQHIFMWVVLVVEILNKAFDDGQIRALQKKLHEVPSDLDEVFSNLLEKGNPDKQGTILMLQWVLFAVRPLSPEELYFAAMTGNDEEELGAWDRSEVDNKTIQRFITCTSRGLAQVRRGRDGDTVQFIHESVNDFLIRNRRLWKLDPALEPHAIGASHNRLASCCMSYIMQKGLDPLVMSKPQSKEELAIRYPFLHYASTQVFKHAEKAQAGCIPQQAFLHQLQRPHGDFDRLQDFHDTFEGGNRLYNGAELLYAVSLGCYCQLLQTVLLKHVGDINAQGGHYGSALQAAAAGYGGESKAVVALLLQHGADVNAQGGHFGSALQAAAAEGYGDEGKAVVALLLQHGADVNAQGGYYGSALQAAAADGDESKAVVALLLQHGADVNAQGGYYGSALQAAAATYGDEGKAVVALLLEHGAINA
jgi:hypothetical protein